MDDAAGADDASLGDGHTRFQDRALPDARAALDHAQRADAGRGVDLGLRVDDRAGVDAGACRLGRGMARLPQAGQAGEVQVGVVGHDGRTAGLGGLAQGRAHDDTGRLGGGQLGLVAGVAQEAELTAGGRFQRRQALDGLAGVADQLPPQCLDDVTQSQRHLTGSRRR